jgi:iron complex transport system ATP-binding protein
VVITAQSVSFSYPRGPGRLENINLVASTGEILGIVGPNGAGKSTLLKVMAGLLTPSSGRVTVADDDLGRMTHRERARRIAYLPQQAESLFPFRVQDVVLMGRAPYQPAFGFDSAADLARAAEALREMGVSTLAGRNIQELSGGERQRVLLTRVLVQEAPAILMDEPTSHVDPGHVAGLAALWRSLAARRRAALVIASHDLSLVGAVADRIALLAAGGKLVRVGTPREVLVPGLLGEVFGARWVVGADQESGQHYVLPQV